MKRISICRRVCMPLLLTTWLCLMTIFAQPTAFGALRAQGQVLVSQEIRYQISDAGEVFLAWGIDGWNQLPEATWPVGTVIRKKVLYSPMTRVGDVFMATVRVPRGATIDYLFHITRTRSGAAVDTLDSNHDQDFHTAATQDGVIEVQPTTTIATMISANGLDTDLQWYGLICLAVVALVGGYFFLHSLLQNPYLKF